MALTPATVKTLTGGKVTPPEAIPVALSLSGPAWAPQISGLDVKPAALTIARLAGASTLRLFGESDLGKAAAGALGGSGSAGTDTTQGEQKAQSEPRSSRQQAEEDARKRLQGLFGK